MIPVISVSEISRMLINLRKSRINEGKRYGFTSTDSAYMKAIDDIRNKLELRRRSRQYVQKNIRSIRKVDSKAK